MARLALRAVAFAIIGFGTPICAYANGLVEDAQQLFFADLTDAYNDSVEYLEAYNTNDGAVAIAELHELTEDMVAATYQIQQNAAALSPALGEAWGSTQRAMDALNSATGVVKAQVGREQVRLDTLESTYNTAGSELQKAYAYTQDFGKKYATLMSGPVENAKALYSGAVTDSFKTTVGYLEGFNIVDGKPALDNLTVMTGRLVELSQQINEDTKALSPALSGLWSESTYYDINELNIEAGILSTQVGKMAFSLDKLKSTYGTAGSGLDKSYTEMKNFGSRFAALCDSCR